MDALHGDRLLEALTATAVEVQRARSVEAVLQAAGDGLERLGYGSAVLSIEGERAWLRSIGGRELAAAAAALGVCPGPGRGYLLRPEFLRQQQEAATVFFDDLPAVIAGFFARNHVSDDAVSARFLPGRSIVVPLHVHRGHWGALVLMHDGLEPADTNVVRLFGLQLGSAIEVAEGLQSVQQRQEEFELVQRLALAGPRSDSTALCQLALASVCRTTGSDAGTLHRFDADDGVYVLVGQAHGFEGPLVERFTRFPLPPEHPLLQGPLALVTRALPTDADAVRGAGFEHLAVVPLAIEGKPVGLLTLARRRDVAYPAAALRSAELLGVQMASLLERTRLYDEAGRLFADLKTSYDELARAQRELVRHERLAALGELAAVMAHEVRNPLGVIFNSLTTLRRLWTPTGDVEMLLNIVGEESERLNRIVGDLLDFVRPFELVKKMQAIEALVAGAVDAAAQATQNANVKVVAEFPRELPPFPVDAHMVKQALVNLLVNAAQAMPHGGTVLVRADVARRDGQLWLCLSVQDEGVGLSARAAEKMFQPFFTTKATGTGLGLAVVKRIVDAHLGEIAVRANAGGMPGTTFTIHLPHTTDTRNGIVTPPRPSPAASRR